LIFSTLGSPCPIHIILPDVINQTITNEPCIFWLFVLCSVRHPRIAACLLVPNTSRLTYNRIYLPVRCLRKYLDRDVNYIYRYNAVICLPFL
jgi:hypothetical protein